LSDRSTTIDPPLPHSRDAEIAFLGAILLGSGGPAEIQLLDSADFFLPFHRVIHRHMKRLAAEGRPTNDIVVLCDSLQATNDLEAAGGIAYLSQLADGLPRVSNLAHYAKIINSKSAVRDRLARVDVMREKLLTCNGNAADVLEEVAILSAPLREDVGQKRILSFKTAAELAAASDHEIAWITTGYAAKGSITEIGAKVKAGKTTLVLAMVRAVVDGATFLGRTTLKTPVVYLTEQPGVSFRQAMERADLLGREDFTVLPFYDTRGMGWPEVAAAAVKECRRIGASLLVVDTLSQFAGLTGDKENNSGDALEAIRPLQEAASEGIGVVVIRHERKSGGEVGDSGRGSSAFAGAVDIVVSLRRPEGNASKNRRLLQSLSRFHETPADLLIELTDEGYVALGEPGETAVKDAKDVIFAAAPQTETEALALKELVSAAKVSRQTAQRALDELVREGMLSRAGKGKRGDPFRYFIPENRFCPTPIMYGQKESNPGGL
jgi:DnaB-like helicase N terminal domain/AAA domain/Bacterial regulatory proteins, gntR family